MARTESHAVPWDDLRVLLHAGFSMADAADKVGINKRTITTQIEKYNPDLRDLSKVRPELFAKWGLPLPEGVELPIIKTVDGTDLSWEEISDYLGLGLTIKEVSAAAGVDPEGLSELYERDKPSVYDSIETWATVLRARRQAQLILAIEKRAMDGDLRAAVTLTKMRSQRWPKDCLPCPTTLHEV